MGDDIVDGVNRRRQNSLQRSFYQRKLVFDLATGIKPSGKFDLPWERALELLLRDDGPIKKVEVTGELGLYCAKCGVSGRDHLGGQAKWTIAKGLEKASIDRKSMLKPLLGTKQEQRSRASEATKNALIV